VATGLFFDSWGGSGILSEIMHSMELTDYACPWCLLCRGPGRSWAVNDTPGISGVEHRMNVKGGDYEKSI
jgi:hypothetical protein